MPPALGPRCRRRRTAVSPASRAPGRCSVDVLAPEPATAAPDELAPRRDGLAAVAAARAATRRRRRDEPLLLPAATDVALRWSARTTAMADRVASMSMVTPSDQHLAQYTLEGFGHRNLALQLARRYRAAARKTDRSRSSRSSSSRDEPSNRIWPFSMK